MKERKTMTEIKKEWKKIANFYIDSVIIIHII